MKRRNPGIELYRVVLMFGICALHCVCQGEYRLIWPRNVLTACVPGFVFISGYFGIRFSCSKLVRLYSIALYASLLAPFVGGAWLHGHYWNEVVRVWHADGGFWFLHAYAVLMIFAPIVEPIFLACRSKEGARLAMRSLLPLCVVVFVWGMSLNFSHLKSIIPYTRGLEGGSFLTLLGVYVIGRAFRVFAVECSRTAALVTAVLSFIIISCSKTYLAHVNSILSVALVAALFVLFKSVRMPNMVACAVLDVSPMMFAVYCISGTIYFPFTAPEFFSIVEWMKGSASVVGVPASLMIAAVGSFVCGLLFAWPQRIIARLLKAPISLFMAKLDGAFELLIERLTESVYR